MTNIKKSDDFSLKKRLKSFAFAFNGLKSLINKEHNARIHVIVLICVIFFGVLFKIEVTEWIAVTIVSGLVILAELFNTAIERLADIVEPEWNDKIGLVKDYCAGAVLISSIIALAVGGLIFIPRVIDMIKAFSNNM